MSTTYDVYTGFIPARFCDAQVMRMAKELEKSGEAKILIGSAGFEDFTGVEFNVAEWLNYDTGYYDTFTYSLPPKMGQEWREEWPSVDDLVRDNKISLVFLYHIDYGDDGQDRDDVSEDWESVLKDCPTLVLREFLAQRQEG